MTEFIDTLMQLSYMDRDYAEIVWHTLSETDKRYPKMAAFDHVIDNQLRTRRL